MNNISKRRCKVENQTIGHYNLGKALGEGTFGQVRLALHILTEQKVAVKILMKSKIESAADMERVAREIKILKILRHPNLIQLFEIIENPKQLFLVTEYASGGELFEYIVAKKKLQEREACRIFHQIISGVEYLHRVNVVHRDLKPENLLLDEQKNIKIVDFGLSNTYKPGEKLKTACGSPCYAAPEMIEGKKYVGLQVDIWSVGVVLYAMLAGHLPFEDPHTSKLYKKIMSGSYKMPKFLSKEAQDMLKCLLNTNPSRRYTLDDIRKHPWYKLIACQESPGVIVGFNKIPIEPSILTEMEQYGFNSEYAIRCIEANKHNHLTATYYLLLKKNKRFLNHNTSRLVAEKPPALLNQTFTVVPPTRKPETCHPVYREKCNEGIRYTPLSIYNTPKANEMGLRQYRIKPPIRVPRNNYIRERLNISIEPHLLPSMDPARSLQQTGAWTQDTGELLRQLFPLNIGQASRQLRTLQILPQLLPKDTAPPVLNRNQKYLLALKLQSWVKQL